MGIIDKLLGKFAGDSAETTNDDLSNKQILAELSTHFREVLKFESVGKRMLYPMSFNILMDPDDYAARIQALPFVLPEVVSTFYDIIKEMRVEYPNYTPPAKYWYFQFSACCLSSVPNSKGSTPLIIRKGHIATVAELLSPDIMGKANNTTIENNVKVSIKLDDSNVMTNTNVNMDAISKLDIISEGTFTYNFDYELTCDTEKIMENSNLAEKKGYAELSYSKGGHNIRFLMKDKLIHISGQNEQRQDRSFFIIDSPNILNDHVQIRYLAPEHKFQIAAFGPTRLNSYQLEKSSGGDVIWRDLANNSSIFINNEVRVNFLVK